MITGEQNAMIEATVREAGKMILDAHLNKKEIHHKQGISNFVTVYDVKIQRFLISELAKVLPNAGFYGEEDTEENDYSVGDGYTFFIDPIDGTTNFMFDYHNSCVSVGLSLNGEMLAGWVFNPYTDQFWSARKGFGAWLDGRELHIDERNGLESGICAFGCARYNEGDRVFSILKQLFMKALSIRNGGSAAIDLCRIASGNNVGYVELKLQPYDYAAASVIIVEAGGVIGQADGSPITLDKPCSIVAGNMKVVEEIRKILDIKTVYSGEGEHGC